MKQISVRILNFEDMFRKIFELFIFLFFSFGFRNFKEQNSIRIKKGTKTMGTTDSMGLIKGSTHFSGRLRGRLSRGREPKLELVDT